MSRENIKGFRVNFTLRVNYQYSTVNSLDMNEYFLFLGYLNAWEYCHCRFYWEYERGKMEANEHILIWRHLHRNINHEGVSEEDDVLIHRQQWAWSDRLLVSGIIDAVEERDSLLIPLEYKKGKMGNYLNDRFQLCAAALCLEERLGREIGWGEIFYAGNKRREKVNFFTSR